jgi:hypothetical protein
VVMPLDNRPDLCLSSEVTDACAQGRFHVWGVSTLEDAATLCAGIPAGTRGQDGRWTEGALFERVSLELRELRGLLRAR